MRTIRLYSPIDLAPGSEVDLDPAAAHRLGRVLRRRVGDPVTIFNGDGRDAACEIVSLSGRDCRVRVGAVHAVDTESPLVLHLVQAVAKGDKMDWVIQKAVELGVTAIHPVLTEHGDVRLDAARAEKRRLRWQEIVIGACEQCGRARVPNVAAAVALDDWVPPDAVGFLLDPDGETALVEAARPGTAAIEGANEAAIETSIAIAIGPEGGFGPRDRARFEQLGYRSVRFGPRVLRTETAGAAALAVLQAKFGDLGSATSPGQA